LDTKDERDKAKRFLATAPTPPPEGLVNEPDKSIKASESKLGADLFHLDPENIAKIDRALRGEQSLKKDSNAEFFDKFTPQDMKDNLYKDERIIAIQQKYQKKTEEVYRQQQ
jgi:hypothetical protein